MISNRLIDYQDRNSRSLVGHLVFVDANNDLVATLNRFLILISGVLNLSLRKTFFDRRNHPSHGIDLSEVSEGLVFHLLRKRLEIVRAAERIYRMGNSGLFSNDLLCAKGNECGPI